MQCPCSILSSVACLDLPYFSTLINGTIFEKKIFVEHNVCVLILYATFVGNIFIPRITERGMIKNVY